MVDPLPRTELHRRSFLLRFFLVFGLPNSLTSSKCLTALTLLRLIISAFKFGYRLPDGRPLLGVKEPFASLFFPPDLDEAFVPGGRSFLSRPDPSPIDLFC